MVFPGCQAENELQGLALQKYSFPKTQLRQREEQQKGNGITVDGDW